MLYTLDGNINNCYAYVRIRDPFKVVDFCHWIGREELDVGTNIYKSTVNLKEMALPQKMKVSPGFCDL